MHLLIYGRGKMAQLLREQCHKHLIPASQTSGLPFPEPLPTNTIVIHVSTKRHVEPLIKACGECGYPLIQASSGIELPQQVPGIVIDAPNLALPIAAIFDVLALFGQRMQTLGAEVSVVESHQASKTSAPITAQKFARYFGQPATSVESIRNPVIQELLGVPKEHLDGHAYHIITVKAHGMEVVQTIKVHGRTPYFPGVIKLARMIDTVRDSLAPGVYAADQILFA